MNNILLKKANERNTKEEILYKIGATCDANDYGNFELKEWSINPCKEDMGKETLEKYERHKCICDMEAQV